MKKFLANIITQCITLIVMLFILQVFLVQAAPGDTPLFTQAFNSIFGQPADQNIQTTLSVSPAVDNKVAAALVADTATTAGDSDMVDGLHAADLSAASGGGGMGTLVVLYTRVDLAGDWECLSHSQVGRGDSWNHVVASQGSNAVVGGIVQAWSGQNVATNTGGSYAYMCFKYFN